MKILLLVFAHYYVAGMMQTIFLHRYASHRMFTMSKPVERAMHLLTYLTQGSSYLVPRGYALLHRAHHAFADAKGDPHSPVHYGNVLTMMYATKNEYDPLQFRTTEAYAQFDKGDLPEWPALDALGRNYVSRIGWIVLYAAAFYALGAKGWEWLLLIPMSVAGPIAGAIVNWCGHRYGYRNYDSDDKSTNHSPIDVVTWGEGYQNNHHKFGMAPNFAVRWWEVDLGYQCLRVLAFLRLIKFNDKVQVAKYPA